LPLPAGFSVTCSEITSTMDTFSRTSAMSSSRIRPAIGPTSSTHRCSTARRSARALVASILPACRRRVAGGTAARLGAGRERLAPSPGMTVQKAHDERCCRLAGATCHHSADRLATIR
jgi:hypothetical protein